MKKSYQLLLVNFYHIWKDHEKKYRLQKKMSITFFYLKNCLFKSETQIKRVGQLVYEILSAKQVSVLRWQTVWDNYPNRSSSPDKQTACLRNLNWLFFLVSSQLSIRKTSIKRTEKEILHSYFGVQVVSIGTTPCWAAVLNRNISWSEARNHQTTASYLILQKEIYNTD